MIRHFLRILPIFLLVFLAACQTSGTKATVTQGQGSPTIDQAQAEAYDGPKARIAVAQFKDKTGGGWWSGQIGDGMADQMTTALFNTNRYIVLERSTLNAVLQEQDLASSGRVSQATGAPTGQIEGAELLIVGAVTEFEGNASGAQGGVGGGGGSWAGAIFGGIAGGYKKSHMAIDVRVIDTRTSRIVAATSVEGEATDVNMGALLGGFGTGGALAGGLSGWKNTPTEKALRICIQKAVDFVVTKTPATYYHHGSDPRPVTSQAAETVQKTASSATDAVDLDRDVIRDLQTLLSKLGYNPGTPDGLFGKKTAAAISAFQKDYGLPVTGSFTPDTIMRIRQAVQ